MKRKGWKMSEIILWCFFLFILIPTFSIAQEYPSKPINLTLNRAPGGMLDITTSVLAKGAEKFLGQPFIISNNGAGGGTIVLATLARDKPDGYHLVGLSSSALIRNPQLSSVPYELGDFIPILHFAYTQTGLVVRSDSPWKTLKELIEYARKNPGKVTYSLSGVYTASHLAMEYIAKQEKIQWTYVPFQGGQKESLLSSAVMLLLNQIAQNGFPMSKQENFAFCALTERGE